MDQLSTIILAAALIIIMLGKGLSLVAADFQRIFRHPKAILVGLTNQIILLPLIGFALAVSFPIQPEIAIGLMILAACPGGPTSNLIAHLAKGNTALSVTLTALSSLITIITIPFIVNIALIHFLEQGQMIQLNVLETILQILVIIVIPISIGMLIRRYRPGFALKMGNPVRKASGVVMMLVIAGLIVKERANVLSYFQQAGIIALCLNIITMLVGYYSAKLINVTDKSALSIAIESGIQNGTLAITIAVVLLENNAYAITPAIYSLLMFLTGGVVIYWGLRKSKAAYRSKAVT